MNFKVLFDLRLEHTYYKERRCSDFQITPDKETEKQLGNHRMVMKSRSDGMQLILPVNSEGRPWIPLPEGLKFSFRLRLHNPDFMLFTDLVDFPATKLACYSNEGLDAGEDIELKLKSLPAPKPVDFFAQIDIFVNSSLSMPSDLPRHFVINFRACKARWLYYLVTNKKIQAENQDQFHFHIKHESMVFKKNDAESGFEKVSKMLIEQYPDMQHLQFVSEQLISCNEVAKQKIQLFRDIEHKLLENLPNPPIHNFSKLTIKNGDEIEIQDSLYQIVKYISQPFTTNGT